MRRCSPTPGLARARDLRIPVSPKPLARDFTANHLERDADGLVAAPDAPGLGVDIDAEGARRYLVDVEIRAKGRTLFVSSDQF